ncbi:MAG: hypothetical protein M3O78_02700 [Chloroflexota bacterium]|nr:hypothetical protein [Chloroflexota bacterium]
MAAMRDRTKRFRYHGGRELPAIVEFGPEEATLSAAISTCDRWVEECHDPAIRAAFRLALHELRQLLP